MSRHNFFQAGDFNLRMSVQSPSQVSDGFGGFTKSWQFDFFVWARLVPIKAALVSLVSGNNTKLTHYIYLRKNNDLKSGMRFVKGERIFEIETIQDPDETQRYLVCTVCEINCQNQNEGA